MRRIVREETNDGEIRYSCEECREIDGAKEWRIINKYDVSMMRYSPAIFSSMRQAEAFMRNKPYTMRAEVAKRYEY